MLENFGTAKATAIYPWSVGLLFTRVLNDLGHVDAAQRQQPLVARVELLVVLKDQLDQFIAIDEAQVALRLGEALRWGRERAERDHKTALPALDLAVERGDYWITDAAFRALDLHLDDRRFETQFILVSNDVYTTIRTLR